MALEPPAKRRRLLQAVPDESDDDELSFQPDEVSARRDPDYRLSVQRVQSEHKLQSAMEKLFDKYSHDFDGVGDEIDMLTGEIVVNNGHLSHLPDDDEDRILSGKSAPDASDEDEDDRIMKGRGPSPLSTALVPRGYGPPSGISMPDHFPGQHGGQLVPFAPPPLPFEASPFAFGASPLALGPWGIPNDFGGPSNHTLGFDSIGSRYDFPMRDNHMALTAPRTTSRMILGPWRKTILAAARRKRDGDDEDDEEAILTGKRPTDQLEEMDDDASEDDDDLLLDGSKYAISTGQVTRVLTTRQPIRKSSLDYQHTIPKVKKSKMRFSAEDADSGRTSKNSTSLVAKHPSRQSQMQLVTTKVHQWPHKEVDLDPNRRRSGRACKQVEFLGKISWADALADRRNTQTMMVELRTLGPGRGMEYERIDEAIGDEPLSSPARSLSGSPDVETSKASEHARKGVVPDSQDSATPLSSAPRQAVSDGNSKAAGPSKWPEDPHDIDSACFLSDEETPTLLFRPKSVKGSKRDSNTLSESTYEEEPPALESSDLVEDVSLSRSKRKLKTYGTKRTSTSPTALREGSDHITDGQSANATPGEKPLRLKREVRRLKQLAASSSEIRKALAHLNDDDPAETDASKKQLRSSRSRSHIQEAARTEATEVSMDDDEGDQPKPAQDEVDPFGFPEDDVAVLLSPTPSASHLSFTIKEIKDSQDTQDTPTRTPSKPTPSKPTHTPPKPQTPRHAILSATKAPSSRRSVLSLLSDDDDDGDELGSSIKNLANSSSVPATKRKIWKATALTTEVYRTPVKNRGGKSASPGSVVKTPGGTLRTCGVNGYRCGRDFCFTCL